MGFAWDDLVLVGRVTRTHGIRGEVVVKPDTDFAETRFAPGATVWMVREGAAVPVVIQDVWFHNGRPVLTLEGITSMNDAEALRGAELRVPETALTPLPEGTYYQFQLAGCEVVTVDGRAVGTVHAVEGESGGQRLVVRGEAGEVLVPLAEPICVQIDVAARRIVIDPPDGLLELNARGARQE